MTITSPRAAGWRKERLYLTSRGVCATGTAGCCWDAPFVHTAAAYAGSRGAGLIWEGHKACHEIGYCHIDKLHDLERLSHALILKPSGRDPSVPLRAKLIPAIAALRVGVSTDAEAHYGPVINAEHRSRVENWIQTGVDEGAELVVDGRGFELQGHEDGFFIGPSLFDHVTPDMSAYREEIFAGSGNGGDRPRGSEGGGPSRIQDAFVIPTMDESGSDVRSRPRSAGLMWISRTHLSMLRRACHISVRSAAP